MTRNETIRAWKDETFRLSLTEAQRAGTPENPAGPLDISARELEGSAGGRKHAAPLLCPKTRKCASLIPGTCPRTFDPRQCHGSTFVCTLGCTGIPKL